MVWMIARKEFLASLLTYRFGIGLILCIVAVTAGILSSIEDYGARREAYQKAVQEYDEQLKEEGVYAQLVNDLKAFREPRQLAVFSVGSDRWQGNQVAVTHHEVPVQAEWLATSNPYMVVFRSIDLSLIVQIILGLLALLFAYDAISGEREEGTLKLMLANSVARDQVLLGKTVGHLSILSVILLIGFLVALLFVQTSTTLSLGSDDFARIAAILATSLLYLMAMYFIGLILSTFTQRSAIALVFAMFIWVSTVAIYPNAVAYTVDTLAPVREQAKSTHALQGELSRLLRKELESLSKDKTGSERPRFSWRGHSSSSGGAKGYTIGSFRTPDQVEESKKRIREHGRESPPIEPEKPEEIARKVKTFKEFFAAAQQLRIRYADQIWAEAWAPLEEYMRETAAWTHNLMLLSPAGAFLNATAIMARTDREDYWRFLEDARQYRKQLIKHFEEEGYFSAREWFNDQEEKVTLEGLPRFHETPLNLWQSLAYAAPNLLVLGAFSVFCFLGTYWRFRRCEVA